MGVVSVPSKWDPRSSRFWVLLAAVWFFCLGLVGGLTAGLAAAVTGAFFWWLFVERLGIPTYSRGFLAGFLAQLAAYPVMYLLSRFVGLPGFFGDHPAFTYSGPIPSGAEIVDVVEGLTSSGWFFGFGVIVTGPIGVAGGLVLVTVRRRFAGESEGR